MDKPGLDRVVFREAAPADADRIAALHVASWRSAYRGSLPDAYLDGEAAAERRRHWRLRLASGGTQRMGVILAETGAETNAAPEKDLAGFACVLLEPEPAWGACVDNLHVRPDLRGRGIGRRLFVKAARRVQAAAPGCGIHLWVFESNAAARRFYESAGGTPVERACNPLPGGVRVASVRYFWKNAGTLAALDGAPGADL